MEELENLVCASDVKGSEEKIFDCCKAIIHDESSEHVEALICHYGNQNESSSEKETIRKALAEVLRRILQLETRKEQVRYLQKFVRLSRLAPIQLGEGIRLWLIQKVALDEFCHDTRIEILCAEILAMQNMPAAFWKTTDIKRCPEFWFFYLQSMIAEKESVARIAAAVSSSPEGMSEEFQVRAFHAVEGYCISSMEEVLLSAPPWFFRRLAQKEEAA